MGGEVLLFNRQINNKLSKTFFTFSLYFVFAGYRRCGGSPHPTQNQIPISNKRAALLLCAALLFFFNTHQHFCYSLLRQPDRWVHTDVKSVHQPTGAVRAFRTCLTDAVR